MGDMYSLRFCVFIYVFIVLIWLCCLGLGQQVEELLLPAGNCEVGEVVLLMGGCSRCPVFYYEKGVCLG